MRFFRNNWPTLALMTVFLIRDDLFRILAHNQVATVSGLFRSLAGVGPGKPDSQS
jgi:hypothetical protein